MATLKYYAQKDAYGFPIPGTMMALSADLPLPEGVMEIPAADQIPTPVRKGQGSDLRYFVRHDVKGNIIPNSLITSIKKPKGLVYEFNLIEGSAGPAPAGTAAFISRNQMGDTPACSLSSSNLQITIEEGKTFSSARYIYGDFASLGAYYTPADPNDGMAQPPLFVVSIVVEGLRVSKAFRLTSAGVAENYNTMLGAPDASGICPTYYVVDQYFDCNGPAGVDVNIQVTNGTSLVVGKYYKFGQGSVLIKSQSSTPLMMASTLTPGTAYNTCAESLA